MEELPVAEVVAAVVEWYRQEGRVLSFRETRDPYRVWLAEVVFQQTRIEQGLAKLELLLERFPDVQTLAAASLDDVLHVWEGLGYYTRARNLHRAAQELARWPTLQGEAWPQTAADWETLPGIGPYTARAIAASAFGERVAVLDGNIYRVLSRYHADTTPINQPASRRHYQPLADAFMAALQPTLPPATLNNALMDLGSLVCTPRTPRCSRCPLKVGCQAHLRQQPEDYPLKTDKHPTPTRYFQAFWIQDPATSAFLAQQRDDRSWWKGLWELPTREVTTFAEPGTGHSVWQELEHVFSHFKLRIRVYVVAPEHHADYQHLFPGAVWLTPRQAGERAFGKPMRQAVERLLSGRDSAPRIQELF
jgi:A/G-specific adenine glycosylase